ncbi:hypothetical protein J4418_03985 [Candidatus Woesearchaeota archaeon]|nr:hypothetical protein [Candidatus Woesearchaeota archaeon]
MLEKLKKELKSLPKNFIVGVVLPTKNYEFINLELLRMLSAQKGVVGGYVSVNRPFNDLSLKLKSSNISLDNLFFIDCITKEVGGKSIDSPNCVYIDSPKSLTDIGIAMHQFIVHTKDYEKFLYVDSISTLGIHNDSNTMLRFIHFLTGKIRLWGIQGVMVALHEDSDQRLIAEISQFCDKMIDLT